MSELVVFSAIVLVVATGALAFVCMRQRVATSLELTVSLKLVKRRAVDSHMMAARAVLVLGEPSLMAAAATFQLLEGLLSGRA